MKYNQVNDLYKVERAKVRVNDNNFVGGKSEIQLSLRVHLGRKNEFRNTIFNY